MISRPLRRTHPVVYLSFQRFRSAQNSFRKSSGKSLGNYLSAVKSDSAISERNTKLYKSRAALKLEEIDNKLKIFDISKVANVVDLGFAPGAWTQVAVNRLTEECTKYEENQKSNQGSDEASYEKPSFTILGVDINNATPVRGCEFIQGDITKTTTQQKIYQFFKNRNVESRFRDESDVVKADSEDQDKHEIAVPDTNEIRRLEGEERRRNEKLSLGTAQSQAPGIYRHDPRSIEIDDFDPFSDDGYSVKNIDLIMSDMMVDCSGSTNEDHIGSMELCYAALYLAYHQLKPGKDIILKVWLGKELEELASKLKLMFNDVIKIKPKASKDALSELYFVGRNKFDMKAKGISFAKILDLDFDIGVEPDSFKIPDEIKEEYEPRSKFHRSKGQTS